MEPENPGRHVQKLIQGIIVNQEIIRLDFNPGGFLTLNLSFPLLQYA